MQLFARPHKKIRIIWRKRGKKKKIFASSFRCLLGFHYLISTTRSASWNTETLPTPNSLSFSLFLFNGENPNLAVVAAVRRRASAVALPPRALPPEPQAPDFQSQSQPPRDSSDSFLRLRSRFQRDCYPRRKPALHSRRRRSLGRRCLRCLHRRRSRRRRRTEKRWLVRVHIGIHGIRSQGISNFFALLAS